jgi:hypothetical protein
MKCQVSEIHKKLQNAQAKLLWKLQVMQYSDV